MTQLNYFKKNIRRGEDTDIERLKIINQNIMPF